MKKIIIFIHIIFSFIIYGYFSITIMDNRNYLNKDNNYRGVLEINHLGENRFLIKKIKNIQRRNLLLYEYVDYKYFPDKDNLNEILNKVTLKDILEISNEYIGYKAFKYLDIENDSSNIFWVRGNRRVNKDKWKIIYDISYNNNSFIVTDNEEKYKNNNIRNLILYFQYFIEKYDCDFHDFCIFVNKSHKSDFKIKEPNDINIHIKKYINKDKWKYLEINKINDISKIKKINQKIALNYLIFEEYPVKDLNIKLSEKTILEISNDDINITDDFINSKSNIVINNKENENNLPKIVYYNGIKLKNLIIYEISYKGYMFKIIGNEKLYGNSEIKNFIKQLKKFDVYL